MPTPYKDVDVSQVTDAPRPWRLTDGHADYEYDWDEDSKKWIHADDPHQIDRLPAGDYCLPDNKYPWIRCRPYQSTAITDTIAGKKELHYPPGGGSFSVLKDPENDAAFTLVRENKTKMKMIRIESK